MENINVITLIEKNYNDFSKQQRKIANTILNDYQHVLYLTASELAELADVSNSTVVRFAMELGFEGYPEFQLALEEVLKKKLTGEQRMISTKKTLQNSNKHILKTVMQHDIQTLEKNLSVVNEEVFDESVKAIVNARTIYVIGNRSSMSLASFLDFYLKIINCNSVLTKSNSVEDFEFLTNVNENDIVIALSFPRYYNATIRAAKHAKEQGAKILTITDSETSPIAKFADYVLASNTRYLSVVDSLVAPFSLINALLVAVSLELKDQVVTRLNNLEKIWDENGTYYIQPNDVSSDDDYVDGELDAYEE